MIAQLYTMMCFSDR